ncbi:hypothetical protein GCM10020369_44740 [Cryptosporangium minutisporangium]|uniref:Uncharacterized protein n=1 Tax=Cryptosporangium minutisporangium TaxID=113569 RepID=A0ABP6T120_9ACTN
MLVGLQGLPGVLTGGDYLLNPGEYAVLNRVFEHPFLLATGGVVLLLVAMAIGVRRRFVRFGALGVAGLLVAFGLWLGFPLSSEPGLPTAGRQTVEHRSPDGRYTAAVTRWGKLQGPAWLVVVRSNDGLWSREHLVGCVDGNGGLGLDRVAWVDPTTLRLYRSDEEEYDFRLDATTGAPDHELYGGDVDACYQL